MLDLMLVAGVTGMAKALSFTIAKYPEHEAFIRARWSADEDFEEICEHFFWMWEAAELNADTPAGKHFAELRDDLRDELQAILDRSPKEQIGRKWRSLWQAKAAIGRTRSR